MTPEPLFLKRVGSANTPLDKRKYFRPEVDEAYHSLEYWKHVAKEEGRNLLVLQDVDGTRDVPAFDEEPIILLRIEE